MNKPWVGYLSSILLLFAGLLMILGGKPALGAVFIGLSIVGLILKLFMNKGNTPDT